MRALTFTGWVLMSLSFLRVSVAVGEPSLSAVPDSKTLAHFKEPSLRVKASRGPAQQIRLLMFRSFHAPVSVRAFTTDGGPRLRVARLAMKDGQPPDTLDLENEVGLSAEQWARIVELSSSDKARDPLRGLTKEQLAELEHTDGSTWVLEVRDGEHYSRAEVRSPNSLVDPKWREALPEGVVIPDVADFVACCRYLLRFAPMDEEQIY